MREDVLEFMYWILQTVHTNAVKTNKSQKGLLEHMGGEEEHGEGAPAFSERLYRHQSASMMSPGSASVSGGSNVRPL